MSRLIRCDNCNTKVADIRDGSLMKGMACYCAKCNNSMRAKVSAANYYASIKRDSPLKDIFEEVFR